MACNSFDNLNTWAITVTSPPPVIQYPPPTPKTQRLGMRDIEGHVRSRSLSQSLDQLRPVFPSQSKRIPAVYHGAACCRAFNNDHLFLEIESLGEIFRGLSPNTQSHNQKTIQSPPYWNFTPPQRLRYLTTRTTRPPAMTGINRLNSRPPPTGGCPNFHQENAQQVGVHQHKNWDTSSHICPCVWDIRTLCSWGRHNIYTCCLTSMVLRQAMTWWNP